MTGITQNIYSGLSDFVECGFLLHVLRESDLFVDVGANAGVYTVLASGAVGASAVTIEPVPETFARLTANLRVNNICDKVEAHNIGLAREEAMLRFTAEHDTMNHIINDENWTGPSIDVPVSTLDKVLNQRGPKLIKIDVEGWEAEVLAGATSTLRHPSLLAWIVEMNSSEEQFSANELAVHNCLGESGFLPHSYDPRTRKLELLPSKSRETCNTIYVRDVQQVADLVASGASFQLGNRTF